MKRGAFLLFIAFPLVGGAGGFLAGDGLSLLTLEARRGLIPNDRIAEPRPGETNEEMALRMSGQPREQTQRAAAVARKRMRAASTAFGVWCGLVVAFSFARLCRPGRLTEYAPHPGRCLSCGHCFLWCPRERARRRVKENPG